MATPFEIGVTFAPTAENAAMGPRRGATQGVQEAVKILSMRIPQVTGARALAPHALLEAPGGAGGRAEAAASAVVRSVLRSVLGGEMPLAGGAPGQEVTSLLRPVSRPSAPSPVREVGAAPVTTDAIRSSAAALTSLLPHIIPGFTEGFGETGFLRQRPGESAFEAIQRLTRPETRQAQLARPILKVLEAQEETAQQAPEYLPRFRKPSSLAGIEELAGLTPGFLRPISAPAPQRTFEDVLRETMAELAQKLSEESRPIPVAGDRFVPF